MEKRLTSFDGMKIHYTYSKGKLPLCLVFLHGVGGNWTVWKKEVEFFQKKGFGTLAIDMRGHGFSDAPNDFEKYQMTNFSKDIYAILQKEKVSNFALVGHSLGGAVAINYCVNFKKKMPSALVLVESACLYPFNHNTLLNRGPYVNHLLRFISEHKLTREKSFFHFKDVDLSTQGIKYNFNIISHLLHFTPLRTIVKSLDNVEKYVFKNKQKIQDTLRDLKIPVLIIAGDKDPVVPPQFSLIMKRLMKGSQLNVLRDEHHLVIMEKSEEVSNIMHNFFMNNLYDLLFI
ncbi:MAG: alpha/beta hydrolase [Nanoarchaeota archaeon]